MFVAYMEGEMGKGLGELTAEDISLYREHLIGTYAAATAAKKLAVLRRFLMFTFMAGATTVNPESLRFFAKSPRVRQDPAYNVLTEEELSRMLSAARASNYRDYVMLAVMAGCGLREAEVVGIKIGDFREAAEEQVFLRVLGKGDKVRNVPISPDLWRLVQRYVLLTERSFTSHPDSRKPLLHLQGGQGQTPHHPLRPEHSKEVRPGRRHNQGHLAPLHPPHRRHQHGRKRGAPPRHPAVPRPLRPQNHHALHPPRRRARHPRVSI